VQVLLFQGARNQRCQPQVCGELRGLDRVSL